MMYYGTDFIYLLPQATADDRLSDAEFRLLAKIALKYRTNTDENGKSVGRFTKSDIEKLKMQKSTFYRLISELVKHGYLEQDPSTKEYLLSVPNMRPENPNIETDQSQIWESQKWDKESEEERSKEEDKEYIYINNSLLDSKKVKENEKEKEIQKKEKDGPEETPERFSAEYREIIDYLNEKTGKKYSAKSRVNQGHMSARLKEGFTVEDFKKVIDTKCFQWKDDPKMSQFLRPETLFSTKFDRYLNEEKSVRRVTENGWEYVKTEEPNFLDEILG